MIYSAARYIQFFHPPFDPDILRRSGENFPKDM